MARNYQAPAHAMGRTVAVPRWLVGAVCVAVVIFFVRSFLSPPEHLIQRLDAPGQAWSAQLWEVRHTRRHLEVRLRQEVRWQPAFLSDPLPTHHREDWRERLVWSTNGNRVYLSLQGRFIWAYDFVQEGTVPTRFLEQAAQEDGVVPIPLP